MLRLSDLSDVTRELDWAAIIGAFGGALATLLGVALRGRYLKAQGKHEVAEAKSDEASAAVSIVVASENLVRMYEKAFVDLRQKYDEVCGELTQLKEEVARTLDEHKKATASLLKEITALTSHVRELNTGITTLQAQVRALGKEPKWRRSKSK